MRPKALPVQQGEPLLAAGARLQHGVRVSVCALVAVILTLAPRVALAETYALLIGVAQVPALPKRLWLRGPDNDVALMRSTLQQLGVAPSHITGLSGLPGDQRPTRQAIEAALQATLQRLQPGDQVLLHLAGHGVQVPQRPGKPGEADGLDEVFLTADTQPWDAGRGLLPQALYDQDIGIWSEAVVARGARLLAVFDTCHAAGLHRGGPGTYTRHRGVAAAELGVPGSRTAPRGGAIPSAPRLHNRVLALAARGHESTPEEWLPKGAAQARVHGVFTHAVATALAQGAGDAEALRQAVERQYREATRTAPVPMVLGSGALAFR